MGRSTSLPNVSAGWEDASLPYRTRPQVCRATIDGKHAADFADKGVDVMVKRKSRATCSERRIIGWREWVSLPALGIDAIKAKLDTGAKTSALHAWDQEIYEQDDRPWVRFSAHPFQRNDAIVVRCSAPLADYRWVRNSGGARDRRYVIATELAVGDATWCCLPLCLVGSPRDLAGLFRRRFAWDGGAIREASGRDEVAFVMNDCC